MIRREITVFLVVGTLTVCVDYLVYQLLVSLRTVPIDVAKVISFIAGTLFAYFANKNWTFGAKNTSPASAVRFMLLYLLTLGVNVGVNALILGLFDGMPWALSVAFLAATAVSAILNFLGMKLLVFKTESAGAAI